MGIAYLLIFLINDLIETLTDIGGIADFNPLHAAALVVGSMVMTLIAGFIPSMMAAGKDPVIALRSE